jgi:D-xylose reductase
LDFGLDYFDMYMIHFPIPLQYVDPAERYPPGWSAFTDKWETIPSPTPIAATWNALEKLFDLGIVKNLGVCNFQGTLLLDLLRSARVFPAVLQIEYHPYLVQDKLLALCKEYDIVVTAHSSFGPSGYREIGSQKSVDTPLLLESELITGLASKHEKSPAQILLRWAVQKGVIVIPKSSSAARRKQNLDLFSFELEEKEMTAINSLDRGIRFNDPGDYLNPPQRIFA